LVIDVAMSRGQLHADGRLDQPTTNHDVRHRSLNSPVRLLVSVKLPPVRADARM
jgi:hypothetical protein